jgi:hypothetical protein
MLVKDVLLLRWLRLLLRQMLLLHLSERKVAKERLPRALAAVDARLAPLLRSTQLLAERAVLGLDPVESLLEPGLRGEHRVQRDAQARQLLDGLLRRRRRHGGTARQRAVGLQGEHDRRAGPGPALGMPIAAAAVIVTIPVHGGALARRRAPGRDAR